MIACALSRLLVDSLCWLMYTYVSAYGRAGQLRSRGARGRGLRYPGQQHSRSRLPLATPSPPTPLGENRRTRQMPTGEIEREVAPVFRRFFLSWGANRKTKLGSALCGVAFGLERSSSWCGRHHPTSVRLPTVPQGAAGPASTALDDDVGPASARLAPAAGPRGVGGLLPRRGGPRW